MPDVSVLAAFCIAVLIGAMVPGPATALVLRRAAVHGLRQTAPVVAGMEIGILCWALAAAVGLAALVAASEVAYLALRVIGAAVLVWFGIQAWRASRGTAGDREAAGAPDRVLWRGFATGLLTNVANPKLAVFFFAFYPQFVPADAAVLMVTMLLGVVHVALDAGWYLLVAMLVGRARAVFRRGAVRRWLERLSGTVLIGLGLRLAVTSR